MFERFTDKARQSVVLAQAEARTLHQSHIETEHLLLGLLRVEDSLAASILAELGVEIDAVRSAAPHGDKQIEGQIPFTRGSKKALELALREALSIGHNYIGTEHILLGISRAKDGGAVQWLPDPDTFRNKVIEKLGATHAIQKTRRFRRGPAFVMHGARQQWEYRVEERDVIEAGWLNDLGAEGWMLAGVSGQRLIFQRQCHPSGELRESA